MSGKPATLRLLRREGANYLKEHGLEQTAWRDAELLLRQALAMSRASFFSHLDEAMVLTTEQRRQYHYNLQQRTAQTPMQYLLGRQEFYGLEFQVAAGVLIPRPETEHLVAAAEQQLRRWSCDGSGLVIAEIGVGSGAIALTLAHLLPGLTVDASDISPLPLQLSAVNAEQLGVKQRVRFFLGDLLAPLPLPQYAMILSNPPYIPSAEIEALAADVRQEPIIALDGGPDGLSFYRRLLRDAGPRLQPNGFLILEIGQGQLQAILRLAEEEGWLLDRAVADFAAIPRVLLLKRKESAAGFISLCSRTYSSHFRID
ncbi:MAG: peptide chain release factor N(5)-glutamine methyltransferase [Negativicutes bacterium]|nr:peptide chain release factor N(5)-glutamine methyltransferase [Negativicutes bacterium]